MPSFTVLTAPSKSALTLTHDHDRDARSLGDRDQWTQYAPYILISVRIDARWQEGHGNAREN